MVQKINGRLYFTYGSPKTEYKSRFRLKFKLSLLSILVGIFLLPNLAYLSAITPEEIIALTNREREAAGLNVLTANQLLTRAAALKGEAILESQTFKHNINDKKFSSWVRDVGYNYSYVGENLAIDFATSQGVIDAWNNSPSHKKNLLSPYYREIGLAAVDGKFQGQDTTVVVQIFGSPAVGSTQPLASDSGLNPLNSNINLPATDLAGYRLGGEENLLTHSILNQKLPPSYGSKLILPAENNQAAAPYKFIAQPGVYAAANNFLIIFSSLTLIYLMVFLYCYYFFRIHKLASI